LDIADGSCPEFVYHKIKPISWFKGITDKKIHPLKENTEGKQYATDVQWYTEYYSYDNEILENEDGEKERKYPNGRLIIKGGDTIIEDRDAGIFPYAIEALATKYGTLRGEDDVHRQIEIQKDFNHKMDNLSMATTISSKHMVIMDEECGLDFEDVASHIDDPIHVFQLKGGADVEKFHDHFEVLEFPNVSAELIQYVLLMPEMLERISGVSKLLQGLAQKKERQTGFEIGKMLETATIRLKDRAGHIEEFIRKIGLISLQLVKENYPGAPRTAWNYDERQKRLTANEVEVPKQLNTFEINQPQLQTALQTQAPEEIDLSKLKIAGTDEPVDYEIDVNVQPDSTLPTDLNTKANLAMQLGQLGIIKPEAVLKAVGWSNIGDAMPLEVAGPGGNNPPAPPPTGSMGGM
jgi:hypothetical protein